MPFIFVQGVAQIILMKKNRNDIYVLGTGLSHDGSACLLKNGKICVAIEKERITRLKHAGGNDSDAINYCLRIEGITVNDLDLVVQNANFGLFKNGNSWYGGKRLFDSSVNVPVVSISHHMAHAYYALGTSQYENTAIFVLDGCGSTHDDCLDITPETIVPEMIPNEISHLYAEKDSLYVYENGKFKSLYKDFSPWGLARKRYMMHSITTQHSIGGFYHAVSLYCFGDEMETGKLMGLAPYGKPGVIDHPIFSLKEGRAFVDYGDWLNDFRNPVVEKGDLYKNFQYYANIAFWAQMETERAVEYVLSARRKLVNIDNLTYTGGVALNAVANGKLLEKAIFKNIYFTPAAGDNGLSIGCAYYGWLEVLKRDRVFHDGSSCLGKVYTSKEIEKDILNLLLPDADNFKLFFDLFFEKLPLFFNKENAVKEEHRIEFVIAGIGIYHVSIYTDRIEVSTQGAYRRDVLLFTYPAVFISALTDNSVLFDSLRRHISLLNGDLTYFLTTVRLHDLGQSVAGIVNSNPGCKIVKFEKTKDFIKKAAEYLADGKVIAWFQNGCEFGPRALGNRSILADPRKEGIQKFINSRVKFREDFRPFAPAVMREHVSDFFHFCGESPYMIVVAKIVDEWKDKVAGVVHVDNSCRIQTVTSESNERLYALLKEFKARTGLPMLLNTSFNKKGMPIVETPAQALSYFYECELDCLVMDDYIITK